MPQLPVLRYRLAVSLAFPQSLDIPLPSNELECEWLLHYPETISVRGGSSISLVISSIPYDDETRKV